MAYRGHKYGKRRRKTGTVTPASIALTVLCLMFLTVYGIYAYQRTGTVIPTMELLDGHANFRFIDVGQGDCTLVTHHGEGILIDAGPRSSGKKAAEAAAMYSPTVDYFIITHPHEDHMGGAPDILRRVKVGCLVLTTESTDEDFYGETLALADRLNIPVLYVQEGMTLTTDSMTVEIFDTFDLETDNLNDRSMIVRISADGTSLLVTGDAETEEEEYLLRTSGDRMDSDLLKTAHHGSSTSSSEAFIRAVSPETAVISCGRKNSYGHPAFETVNRLNAAGAEVRRTDYEGTVLLRQGYTFAGWLRSLLKPADRNADLSVSD